MSIATLLGVPGKLKAIMDKLTVNLDAPVSGVSSMRTTPCMTAWVHPTTTWSPTVPAAIAPITAPTTAGSYLNLVSVSGQGVLDVAHLVCGIAASVTFTLRVTLDGVDYVAQATPASTVEYAKITTAQPLNQGGNPAIVSFINQPVFFKETLVIDVMRSSGTASMQLYTKYSLEG